jgi:hypothetical protein
VWWVGSRPNDVYLGTRMFAVSRGSESLLAERVSGVDGALAVFDAWLRDGEPKRRLRLWLSGGLCRPFIVPPVPGVIGQEEWMRVVTAMAPAQSGLPGPCRVWLSDSKGTGENRVGVAIEESVWRCAQEVVQGAGRKHRLVAIRPWWSEVLRAALKREPQLPLLAVQDCDALTVLGGAEVRFDTATTLTPVVEAEAADAALARMLMTAEVAAGQELRARLHAEHKDAGAEDLALAPMTEWSR